MNLQEIDIISVAAATGHHAAARLCSILMDAEPPLINSWYAGARQQLDDETIAREINELASFICQRSEGNGEVTYLLARQKEFLETEIAIFADQSFEVRLLFRTFTEVTLKTFEALRDEQVREAARIAEEKADSGPALKLEDSILEETGDANEEVAWAEDTRKQEIKNARNAARRKARAEKKAKAEAAKKADTDKFVGEKAPEVTNQTPLNAGETLAKTPAKKGGRPRSRK